MGTPDSPENATETVIVEITEDTVEEVVATPSKKPAKTWKWFHWLALDILATLVWIYVLLKLFVFDVDIFLVGVVLPTYVSLLQFKLLVLMGLLSVALLLARKAVPLALLYILFFPLIVLFIKIPYFIYKRRSWQMAFVFISSIVSFFRDCRINFITTSVFLITFTLLLLLSEPITLYLGAIVLFGLLCFLYFQSFVRVFLPSRTFGFYRAFFPKMRGFLSSSYQLDAALRAIPRDSLSETQLQTWVGNLQIPVLHNRLSLFVARRLRDFQKSRINIAFYLLGLVGLLIFTIFTFSAINFALYKTAPGLYAASGSLVWFDFFYYSFNTLFQASSGIEPLSILTKSVQMIEMLFAFLLLTILLAQLVVIHNEKYATEMDGVVKDLEQESKEVEQLITSEFSLNSIQEAITILTQAKAGFLGLILGITKNLE